MPAGLGTLFAGLLLIVLAFVEGSSVWKSLHEVLFGLFGCGSFVLGAAVCYLAILYTRGEDLLGQVFKLLLGLIFASGTVIVFSDIPADIPAARMVAECYQNGVTAWLGGGALGALLGGNLLLLCGRPAANLVMVVLALCASLYIFDITPAELWQWVCELGGGVHEKGVAVYEQNAARRAERAAARQAEEEAAALEAGEEPEASDDAEEPSGFAAPGWLSGVFSWGHKVTKELEGEAEPEPVDDSLGYEEPAPAPAPTPAAPQEAPAFTPVQVGTPHPRASFDIDLGPDSTPIMEGGSEPIEPFIVGPGGTFGQDPLRKAAPRAIVKPVVPDAVETAAEDFFAKPEEPVQTVAPEAPAPVGTPGIPVQPETAEQPEAEGPDSIFRTPTLPTTDEPSVPVRVMADNVMAMRSAPDEDGWISITSLFVRFMKKTVSVVSATVCSGLFLNLATADQYISIILTGNMFRDIYAKKGYESCLLSRTTEDSVTVTSVLIPWNTCGMTQATILSVPTLVYLPYCFFNIISPLMSIAVAAIGYKIVKRL